MKRQHTPASAQRDPQQPLASVIGRALLGLILMLALLATFTGCSPNPGTPTETVGSGTAIAIITDPDTGCQYIGVYGEAITERIAANGYTHMGCRGVGQ